MRVIDDRIFFGGELYLDLFIIIIFFLFIFLWNDTLNKKLELPAGGGKCLYESFIHSFDSFKLMIHSGMK